VTTPWPLLELLVDIRSIIERWIMDSAASTLGLWIPTSGAEADRNTCPLEWRTRAVIRPTFYTADA
jgi:hypothetical protein